MDTMLDIPNNDVKHKCQINIDNVRMSLQNRINELLHEQPTIKQIDIAKYCFISRGAVSDWVNGKTKTIAGENAFKVAKLFNVNPEWVQSGIGKKRNLDQEKEKSHKPIVNSKKSLGEPIVSNYMELTKNQEKAINDLTQLFTLDIDPMDMVTLQQIIKMLVDKYTNN